MKPHGNDHIDLGDNNRLHGVHEIAQKIRTLKIEETPPQSQNEKKIKPQFSKSSSFGEVRTKEFFNKKEKNTVKNETQDKNLAKKGSFDAGKSTEKKEVKEVKPVERKNTQEITKKPTKSEQFAQQIIEEPQPAKASAGITFV